MVFRLLLLGLSLWLLWRWLLSLLRKEIQKSAPKDSPFIVPEPAPDGSVQELSACRVCGVWRTNDNRGRCERSDCPF